MRGDELLICLFCRSVFLSFFLLFFLSLFLSMLLSTLQFLIYEILWPGISPWVGDSPPSQWDLPGSDLIRVLPGPPRLGSRGWELQGSTNVLPDDPRAAVQPEGPTRAAVPRVG